MFIINPVKPCHEVQGQLVKTPDCQKFLVDTGLVVSPTKQVYVQSDRGIKDMSKGPFPKCPATFFRQSDLLGKDVLDIGTGTGDLVLDMRRLGARAIGIDLKPTSNFRKRPGWFKVANALQTGFAKGSFDMIFSGFSVFSAPENPRFKLDVLKELKRILKKRGKIRLICVEPTEILGLVKKVKGLKVTYLPQKLGNYISIELTKVK